MILNFVDPRRHIVHQLDFEGAIVPGKIKARKSFFLHPYIALPFLTERLNDPFHPQTKPIIIIDKIIEIIRKTMLEITAGRCSSTSEVKACIRSIDNRNDLIVERIQDIKVKRGIVSHEGTRGVFREAISRENQTHAHGSASGLVDAS